MSTKNTILKRYDGRCHPVNRLKKSFQAESDSKDISALDLDFSSFESIRAAAKKLTDDYESGIDILVNCASAGLIPCEDTNDGFGKIQLHFDFRKLDFKKYHIKLIIWGQNI